MKRKLSLLLAMVLAMTIVMGISVTAFATSFPEHVQCGQEGHPIDSQDIHLYVVGTFYNDLEDIKCDCIIGAIYYNNTIDEEFTTEVPGWHLKVSAVNGYDGPGWYSYDGSSSWIKCTSSTSPDSTPKKSSPAHVHSFKWQTITVPTKEADGLEGEMCSCGAVKNTQPLSAYVYALNDYATPMINAAKAGQTIAFEFGEWNGATRLVQHYAKKI